MELLDLNSVDQPSGSAKPAPLPVGEQKKPGIAFALSLVFPGLGHLYCLKITTGLITAAFFLPALYVSVFVKPGAIPPLWGFSLRAAIVLYGFGFLDAFCSAREINAGTSGYIVGNNPRVAATLNLLTGGFGYFYLRERTKGVIWFLAVRIVALSIGMSSKWVNITEVLAIFMAVDAYRIAQRQLSAVVPRESLEPLATFEQGLTSLVPISLGAILVFNYAALLTLGLWMPRYRPIDRSRVTIESRAEGTAYRNPKYGFEITVPADWKIDNKSESFPFEAFDPELGCTVTLMLHATYPLRSNTSVAHEMEDQAHKSNPSYQWLSEGPTHFAGKEAYAINYQVARKDIHFLHRIIFLQRRLTRYSFIETSSLGTAGECGPTMDTIANSVRLNF